jgi:hypothetical protein
LQDEVNNKMVALSVKGAKMSGRLLAKAMMAFLKQARASPKAKQGQQSIKSLTKLGAARWGNHKDIEPYDDPVPENM